MSMFRPGVIRQIEQEMDNTVFGKNLFNIEKNVDDLAMRITLVPSPDYSFSYKKLRSTTDGKFFVTYEAPGDFESTPQEYRFESLAQVKSRISNWLHRVTEDHMLMSPDYSELESLREELLSKLNNSASDEISYFNEEEKISLAEKLEEMEKKIEELYEEKHATQQQVNQMKHQITKLKEGIEILDKRTWLSAAFNRVLDIHKEIKGAKNQVSSLFKDFDNLLPSPESESSQI